MNIEIKNFGPIDYLKIDLDKDLHLIYGKNAVGKSYAIYCVYCLLKSFRNVNYHVDATQTTFLAKLEALNLYSSEIGSIKSIDFNKYIESYISSDLREGIFKEFQNSLLNTFPAFKTLHNRYNNNKPFEIVINFTDTKLINKIIIAASNLDDFEVKAIIPQQEFQLIKKNGNKNKFVLEMGDNILVEAKTQRELSNKFDISCQARLTLVKRELSVTKEFYFLPASRSGLYQALNSFAPIIAELSQYRLFTKSKSIELPALSEPVSDYFLDLSTIDKTKVNNDFESFANVIEKEILKGEVKFDEKTKKISYKPTSLDIELNLSEASSMVAELTPLVLYLRHIINNKFNNASDSMREVIKRRYDLGTDILFIEEPEAHLHPEVQVQLMKVFADLAQNNLKIFITSHSNYMFNELNNLILENKIDKERIAVYHLIHGENGTIQNPEMTVTEDGIYDENFQETSEKLYEERMRILEEAANA